MVGIGRIRLATLLTLLVFVAAACAPAQAPAGQQPSGPVKIAALANLTGRYALTATPLKNGIQSAVDDINAAGGINGRKIELSLDDLGETNDSSINAFNKAIATEPVAVIGMPISTQVFAIASLIKKAGVPAVVAGTNPRLKNQADWTFDMVVTDDISARIVATYLIQDLKKTKIGILHLNDEYGNTGAQILTQTAEGLGGKIVANEAMASGDKDISAQLLNIKRAGAEAIALWLSQADIAVAIKQIRAQGMDITIIGPPILAATIKTLTPQESEGVYTQINALPPQSDDAKVKEWAKRYQEKYNLEADSYAAAGYDGVMMLAEAIKQGGTQPENLRKALLQIKNFKGMYGTHSADANGGLSHQGLIAQITGGSYKAIKAVAVE